MNIDDLCEILNRNENINFLALAVTVLHANGIDACVRKCEEEGIKLEGFVLLPAHPQTGRKLTKYSFFLLNSNISVCGFDYESKRFKKTRRLKDRLFAYRSARKNTNTRVIYVAWTEVAFEWVNYIEKAVPNSKVCFIILDDGGGSYANKYKDELQFEIYKHPGQLKCLSIAKTWIKVTYMKMLQRSLNKNARVVDNRIFIVEKRKNKKVFIKNEAIVKYYNMSYEKGAKAVPGAEAKLFEKAVIINTQCLEENNIIEGAIDLDIYKGLCKELTKNGFRIVIKPHPRELHPERYSSINGELSLSNSFSQELLIFRTFERPLCVISVFSSTLLNCNGLFDIPAISLAKIFKKTGKVNKTFINQLNTFIIDYSNVIQFPNTIEEAVQLIIKYRFYEGRNVK